jgi:DNA polymerase V
VDERPIRVVNFAFNHLQTYDYEPGDLFTNPEQTQKKRRLQQTLDHIKQRFGPNAILRTHALLPESTTRARHQLIGGHRQ